MSCLLQQTRRTRLQRTNAALCVHLHAIERLNLRQRRLLLRVEILLLRVGPPQLGAESGGEGRLGKLRVSRSARSHKENKHDGDGEERLQVEHGRPDHNGQRVVQLVLHHPEDRIITANYA